LWSEGEVIKIWGIARPDATGALENPAVLRAMPRYVKVVKGQLPARYTLARLAEASFSDGFSDEDLFREHERALEKERRVMEAMDEKETLAVPPKPCRSLLHLKILLGSRIMRKCCLCERRCGVDRAGGRLGYCRLGDGMRISSSFVHLGEEPEIVPSFTVCGL